jgi:hypothetical protein
MKFVIAKNTVASIYAEATDLDVSMSFLEGKNPSATKDMARIEEDFLKVGGAYKYQSITLNEKGEYVYEISDEIVLKMFKITAATIGRLIPLLLTVKALFSGYKKEMKKLETLYNELKEPVVVKPPVVTPVVKKVVIRKNSAAKK